MGSIIEFSPPPDRAARILWLLVNGESETVKSLCNQIDGLIGDTPWATVAGPFTRADLGKAAELLSKARGLLLGTRTLLERTERREAARCGLRQRDE